MAAMDRAAEDLGLDDGQDTAAGEIPEATEGEKSDAAVKLQAKIRGNQAREELKEKKEAATKLQANFRDHKAREEKREKEEAAIKMQAAFRGHHARDEMAQKASGEAEGTSAEGGEEEKQENTGSEVPATQERHRYQHVKRKRKESPPPQVVVIGKPVVGKTSLCQSLARHYDLVYIHMEDLVTAAIDQGSDVGLEIQAVRVAGGKIPDSALIDLFLQRVDREDAIKQGWCLTTSH